MRLTLIQPPNGCNDRYDLAPPLGLLSLAASVRERCRGVDVDLIDFNLEGMVDPSWFEGDFYERAADRIAATGPDVVGFTSMAVESHVCLELARRLKQRDSGVKTVLGGPHFSAIAREALEYYPWVDFVVTGEGEQALSALLDSLMGRPATLTNVCRRRDGSAQLDRALKPSTSLDELPEPAYDLVDLGQYFRLNPLRLLDYETGRGCIFRCSFCYSPQHWGQGEQVKGMKRIVDDVTRLRELGAGHLFFVQDNLLNSVPGAIELCRHLHDADVGLTWNCYATMAQLNPPVLNALSAAGCQEVFVGVDAISQTAQKAFAKHFFKGWDGLEQRLRGCLERGIVPTCAFMVDIPENGHEETDVALMTALLCRNLGCGIRLNTLTVYNRTGTALALRDRPRTYTELKPRLLLDTPPVVQENPYARERPELFPFHHTFLPLPFYERFVTVMHTAYTLFSSFPRSLLQYATTQGGSLWLLLDEVASTVGDLSGVEVRMRRPVERRVFIEQFSRHVRSRPCREAFELELAELRLGRLAPEQTVRVRTDIRARAVPYRLKPFEVVSLGSSPEQLSQPQAGQASEQPSPYMVLREGRRLQYFAVDEEVVDELMRLQVAARSGEVVTVRPDVHSGLAAAHLIETESTQLDSEEVLKPVWQSSPG